MKHFADGFEFSLDEGSNVIYVFKGDAFVTAHVCIDAEDAKRKFAEIKKRKKVVMTNYAFGDKDDA